MVEQCCAMFCDPSCGGFWDIMWNDRQTDRRTDRQTPVKTVPSRLPSASLSESQVMEKRASTQVRDQVDAVWSQ